MGVFVGGMIEEQGLVGAKKVRFDTTHLDGSLGAKKGGNCSVLFVHVGIVLDGLRGLVFLAFCLIIFPEGFDDHVRSGNDGDDGWFVGSRGLERLIDRVYGGGLSTLDKLLDLFRTGV